ncbi:MAG: arylmalonate decarboxylase, partial [Pseudomonadota bacterium]
MFNPGQKVKSKDWHPELDGGRHHRARLRFILMSTDLAAVADFFDMALADVAVHVTRLKTYDYTTNETLAQHIDHIADATSRLQPDNRPDVISYSCTSGSIVIGEERVFEEIRKGAPWAQPVCIVTGVVDALRELGARTLVVGTPYVDEINTAEAEFLTAKGFQVLDIQGLNLKTGIEFGNVTPAFWTSFACQ